MCIRDRYRRHEEAVTGESNPSGKIKRYYSQIKEIFFSKNTFYEQKKIITVLKKEYFDEISREDQRLLELFSTSDSVINLSLIHIYLTHLYMLKPFWKDKNRFWVTFDKEDARSLLEGEKMYPCYYPTNRSLKALIKNTAIAWKVLRKEKPDLIISSGAALAVPLFYLGKILRAQLIYIEVFDLSLLHI